MIFFVSVVDLNTCDKIRTIGPESHVIVQEISTFVVLVKGYLSTDRQTRRIHIFKIFALFYLTSDNTLIVLVHSNQMTSQA